MFRFIALGCFATCLLPGTPALAFDDVTITVDAAAEGNAVQPVAAEKKPPKNVVVLTQSGKTISGELIEEAKETITLQLKDGTSQKIDRKDVEAIREVNKPAQQAAGNAGGTGIVVRTSGGAANISGVRMDVDAKDPRERFLVLAPGGPIVVEAYVLVDGQPFRMAREELVARQLKLADTDGDGKPTWKEAVANPRFGFGRLAYYARNKAQLEAYLNRLDRNQNDVVETYEAHAMVASLGGGGSAFNVYPGTSPYPQPDVKEILDENKDGLLSTAELAAAAAKLKSRDANDNDLLEAAEAGGGPQQTAFRGRSVFGRGAASQPPATAFVLGSAANLVAIFDAMQEKYAGADKQIQPEEFRWLPDLVNQLDLDKSGTLDSGELIGLHLIKPHVVLEVNLGKSERHEAGIRVVSVDQALGKQKPVEDKFAAQVVLERPGMKLTLDANSVNYLAAANYSRSAEAMMTRYDADKNGYLDREEIKKIDGQNEAYYVAQFERWDANADGMVYAKEIEESYLEQLAPQMTAVSATAGIDGPSFFQALDETGDNRISLREMQIASRRLASFDKDGDGTLAVDEMPVEVSVTFGRGPNNAYRSVRVRTAGRVPQTAGEPDKPQGPDWFVRMDKNGDGDLTPREFLGGEEKFKQFDTNRDGFIERREAEAVEKE